MVFGDDAVVWIYDTLADLRRNLVAVLLCRFAVCGCVIVVIVALFALFVLDYLCCFVCC